LLLEAGLLAAAGAAAGLGLAALVPGLLERFPNAFGVPLALDLSLNLRVAAMAAAAATVATVLVGIAPARVAWRMDVTRLMKGGGGVDGRGRLRLVEILVAAQVAICLVAVAGAGLFVRTVRHAQASDPMFRAGNALLAGVDLLTAGYDERRGQAFLRGLLEEVRRLPGVQSAAYVKTVPLGGMRGARDVRVNGGTANVQVNTVSAGYFGAAGLPILRGRDFRDGEAASAIVNEQFAARFWPGEDPIGKTVEARFMAAPLQVAGVVRDGRMRTFREAEIAPCLYLPLDADYQRMITLYVRTAGPPAGVAAGVRAAMRDLPFEARTLERHLETALARERLAATLLTALGIFTTALAAIGLYGIVSVAVSQRQREIGIRMALGARRGRVVAGVTARFGWLVGAGTAAGLAASTGLARLVETWVFGMRAADPSTLAAASAFLAAVAAAASAGPALRAARTDPMSVLRED
jgi:predicted permease